MSAPSTSETDALAALRAELRAVADLDGIAATLDWDQATYMPEGGAAARGRQLALVSELAHARRASDTMRDRLADCRALEARDDLDGALVRRARQRHERATKVPSTLVRAIKEHSTETYVAWTQARPKSDFAGVRPLLERGLELSRRLADALTWTDHPLDALIDENDRGTTIASTTALFDELRAELVPFAKSVLDATPLDASPLARPVPAEVQLAFARTVATAIGYDFHRGRMDLTHHPFMTRLSGDDIRITTRVREDDFGEAFFSTVHEVGHALYEQGIAPELDGTPLGEGASSGVHESQSRLWENFVARSPAFWRLFLPVLKSAVPGTFDDVDVDRMVRAVRKVGRSLIRTDADEVTYNLHVMLRFGLEKDLFDGAVKVRELPDAWNARMQRDLGVVPPSDRDGVLQDVHWYCTTIGGAFQGYTLGNLLAAQLWESAALAIPELESTIAQGDFARLREFLVRALHRHGAALDPAELIVKATGRPLEIAPLMRHLRTNYGALHGVG